MAIRTLAELYLASVKHDKPNCLLHKVDGKFVPISTRQLGERVQALAKALRGLGVEPGDRVAMMAENGPHWPTVDFAALCIRAVHVPIYPTLLPDQAAYIANDSGAKVLFVQGAERLAGLLAVRSEMPSVQVFVAIGAKSRASSTSRSWSLAVPVPIRPSSKPPRDRRSRTIWRR